MTRRFVILGSSGMVGHTLTSYLSAKKHQTSAPTLEQFDILRDPLNKLTELLKPSDCVINCAAIIAPRIKDMTVLDVLKINSLFPKNLATLCERLKLPCIHISSDAVFSGKQGHYKESDLCCADDLYGISKACGEPLNGMVLRTSFIGQEQGSSFSLLEWARTQRGKTISGFTNHRWSGITTVYFAEIIERIINENLYQLGIYHLFSPEIVTKFELLSLINQHYDLNLSIEERLAPNNCDRSLSSLHQLSSKLCTKSLTQQLSSMQQFFS